MGAELRIESLYDQAWALHGESHRQADADRDCLRSEIRHRLGPDMAAEIQRRVDVALGRLLADNLADFDPAAERAVCQLRALEMAVLEIEGKIESQSTFFDPYVGGLLPTLGLSWWQDVVPLLDGGTSPGYMPVRNVLKFLAMVKDAHQRLPSGNGSEEMVDHFRQRRRELVEFLVRAMGLGEAVWCDL